MNENGLTATPQVIPEATRASLANRNIDPRMAFEFITDTINQVTALVSECNAAKASAAQFRAMEAATLAKIVAIQEKHRTARDILEKIFLERGIALHKYFEVLDKGLETDNIQLVVSGLNSVTHLIATNPLADFDTFYNAIESGQVIEL
jgi:hydroxylamine reductase (hybrid-cluster protein)